MLLRGVDVASQGRDYGAGRDGSRLAAVVVAGLHREPGDHSTWPLQTRILGNAGLSGTACGAAKDRVFRIFLGASPPKARALSGVFEGVRIHCDKCPQWTICGLFRAVRGCPTREFSTNGLRSGTPCRFFPNAREFPGNLNSGFRRIFRVFDRCLPERCVSVEDGVVRAAPEGIAREAPDQKTPGHGRPPGHERCRVTKGPASHERSRWNIPASRKRDAGRPSSNYRVPAALFGRPC